MEKCLKADNLAVGTADNDYDVDEHTHHKFKLNCGNDIFGTAVNCIRP